MVQLEARPASVHRVPNCPPWFVTPFDRTNEYSCCKARPARLNINGYQRFAIVNAFKFPVSPGVIETSAVHRHRRAARASTALRDDLVRSNIFFTTYNTLNSADATHAAAMPG